MTAQTTTASNPPLEAKLVTQLTLILAVSLTLLQIWQNLTAGIPATYLRPLFLSWILILVFVRVPLFRNKHTKYFLPGRYIDGFLCILSLYAGYTIISFDYNSIHHMFHGLSFKHFFIGSLFMLLVLEATRRSVGAFMAIIGLAFILYNAFGSILPDMIANRGFSFERIIRFQIFTTSGVFGAPLGIAAGVVYVFVLFGAFLEITGAGKYFINLAYAIAGKYRGGPAKASVLASAMLGSISGSAIANTATSGAFTIPMMKKLGYKSEQAAGIEAAASTGGQIMPPIMGAGAFIMAEFTNTKYSDIVLIAIAPAILYFISTLLYVHLMAGKLGLKSMEVRPPLWKTLIKGSHFILPLVFITILLILNYSPTLVGITGCIAIVVAAMIRTHTRINFNALITGMRKGALLAVPIATACATAGIVVGVIGQTGIGLQFTEFVISLANGHIWLALILVMIAALVLGMGLPVTAAYIVVSVVAAPALSTMGLPLVAAHMIIFWFSQTSNVTPPIALAAFTGAGIAGAKPMGSAIEAFRLAQGLFIIPFMMAFSSILWLENSTVYDFIFSCTASLALIIAFAVAIEGYLTIRVKYFERILYIIAIPLLLLPYDSLRIIGILLCTAGIVFNYLRAHQSNRIKGVARI